MSLIPESVCVIGGGVAGLSVAVNLRNHGYRGDIRIYERSPRPGGRLLSRAGLGEDTVLDLGAGRFNVHQHPLVRDLCARLSLELEPFQYDVRYRLVGEGSDLVELRALVKKVSEASLVESNRDSCFATACKKLVGEAAFERLRALSGYDTLGHPSLPIEGGRAILLHHPETECLLHGAMSGWYRIKRGFQSLAQGLEALARDLGISMHYDHSLRICKDHDPAVIRLHFDTSSGETQTNCGRVIFACPPRDVVRILSRQQFLTAKLSSKLVEIPVIKAFFEFDRPWWTHYGLSEACVISDSPARKVYLSDTKSLAWFMCDGASSLESYQRIVTGGVNPTRLLEEHLGCSVPDQVKLINVDYKFWRAAVSFYADATDLSRRFHEISPRILLCSDSFTDSMGWIEGSLMSAQAVSRHITAQEQWNEASLQIAV